MSDEPFYSLKMTPADYTKWQDARGNVEDATAILEAVKRKRDEAKVCVRCGHDVTGPCNLAGCPMGERPDPCVVCGESNSGATLHWHD
jgi:hypothetical protein